MNGTGFDWLNIASASKSESNSPAPPVSFGFNSQSDFNTKNSSGSLERPNTSNSYKYSNALADQLPHSSPSYPNYQTNIGNDADEASIPLSLTAQELTLQESKTYMRWYSDILARTNSRTVSMNDVFNFLHNFKISDMVKDKLRKMFNKILHSINIGEFFALLRLISHSLSGLEPRRAFIKVQTSVPTPSSILSKKRQSDDDDENSTDNDAGTSLRPEENDESKPLDLDSFTQFMLTGERPGEGNHKKRKSKKAKSVKFSDQIVTDIHDSALLNSPIPSPQPQQIDYSLPMDQLLNRINSQPTQQPSKQNDEEEKEILKDMESQINHFQNLHSVDTASIDGVPANIHFHDGYSQDNLLAPNSTGPAQMARYFSPSPQPEQEKQQYLQPNMTGPAQMARYLSPSPQPEQNSQQFLKPNMTGPAQMSQMYNSGYINETGNGDNASMPHVTDPIDMAKLFSPSKEDNGQGAPKISLQSFTDQMTGNTLSNTIQNSRVNENGSPLKVADLHNNRSLPPPVPNNRRARSVSSPTPRIPSPTSLQATANGSNSTANHQNFLGNHSSPLPPPRSPLSNSTNIDSQSKRPVPPPPPPSRKRNTSASTVNTTFNPPPLPPKVSLDSQQLLPSVSGIYTNNSGNDSTANILDDLKALQEEVDKIRNMTGGF